jgi:ribosomal protein S18 acetylase RimI-like enzyme
MASCCANKRGKNDGKADEIMSQATIIVRSANENDATAISDLLSELGYSLEAAHVRKNIALLSSNSSDSVLVAEAVSSVIGVISFHVIPLFHVGGNLGRITSLVVSSQWQRHGVGSELVRAAEEFGWSQGCLRIEVTSGDQREGAHKFYRSLGYEFDERRFIKRSTSQ